MREDNIPLLLVDTGNALAKAGRDLKLKADVNLEGMSLLAYDAVNLGSYDFSFGLSYLKNMASRFSIPFISTNLILETQDAPWFKKYIVKEIAGLNVGIIGLISPDFMKTMLNAQEIKGLHAVPAEEALKNTVHQLRQKVDAVLLLSQLSPEETNGLIHEFTDIDLAVVASKSCKEIASASQNQGPIMLCATPKGEILGTALLRQSHDLHVKVVKKRQLELGDSVLMDSEINDLITKAYRQRKQMANKKREEALRKKLMKGLQMSPEDFMKTMKKGASR
jgi:hypothetical protein